MIFFSVDEVGKGIYIAVLLDYGFVEGLGLVFILQQDGQHLFHGVVTCWNIGFLDRGGSKGCCAQGHDKGQGEQQCKKFLHNNSPCGLSACRTLSIFNICGKFVFYW